MHGYIVSPADYTRCSALLHYAQMKYTQYFQATRQRPDRANIDMDWIRRVAQHPLREVIQQDGRIRRWAPIAEAGDKWLRVVLLSDGETVHNAFFDRGFIP